MTTKTQTNVLTLSKLPTIEVKHILEVTDAKAKKASDKVFRASQLSNIAPADMKRPEVKEAVKLFTEAFTTEAPSATIAKSFLVTAMKKTFKVAKKDAAMIEEETAPETKEDTKKAQAGTTEEKPAPEKEKPVVSFKYFLEHSSIDCYKLSPDNVKVSTEALAYFVAAHQYYVLQDGQDITKEQEHALDKFFDSSVSLLSRNSLRMLITERDAKKKVVAQILVKPVYMSSNSIMCAVEAHEFTQRKIPSLLNIIANIEPDIASGDAFQFNPLCPHLTTTDLTEHASIPHTLEYQFLNVKAYARN